MCGSSSHLVTWENESTSLLVIVGASSDLILCSRSNCTGKKSTVVDGSACINVVEMDVNRKKETPYKRMILTGTSLFVLVTFMNVWSNGISNNNTAVGIVAGGNDPSKANEQRMLKSIQVYR